MAYDDLIIKAADTYGLDANLLRAQMRQESGGKQNAMSNKGASGLMQLMPATARELGVTDIFDPEQNVMAGAKYMRQQLDKYKRPELALAAYNAGPGAVDKYGGIPPYRETQNYVKRIMSNYARLAGDIGNAMINPAMADDAPSEELIARFKAWDQSNQQPQNQSQDYGYGNRPDGSLKGKGWLGELKMLDGSGGVATEKTIGVNIDGKETDIPAIVPTLNDEQKEYILKGGDVLKRKDIIDNAVKHAIGRIKNGLSPYADNNNQPVNSEPPPDLIARFKDWEAKKYKPYNPVDDMSTTDKVLAGVGGAMMDTVQGAGQMVGLVSPEDVAEKRRLDKALLDTSEGKWGNVGGNILTFLPTVAIPGANTLKGASLIGAGIGALQPATSEKEVLGNAALGAGANALGVKLGNVLSNRKADVIPETAKKAIEKGLVIPPTQVKPTFKNRLLEGFSGKITTAQNASAKNQEVFNVMAKNAIGADDLTQEGLSVVRANANKAYDELAQSKPFMVDKAFKSALDEAANRTAKFKADFPGLKNYDVDELIASLKGKKKFNADTTIEAIKRLRQDAATNKISMDASKKELGRVQQKVANSLEDLIERNLDGSDLLGKFREARKTLAKTHDISKAVDISTGNINANKLAQILQKNPNKLTGELRDIAEFAQMYPKAAQNISKMGSLPQSSPLDWALSSLLSAGTGNIGMMAGVMARPAARGYILSKGAQNALVKATQPKNLSPAARKLLATMPAALANSGE